MRTLIFTGLFLFSSQVLAFTVEIQKVIPSLFSEFSSHIKSQHVEFGSEEEAQTYLKDTLITWAKTSGHIISDGAQVVVTLAEKNTSDSKHFYEIKVLQYDILKLETVSITYQDVDPKVPLSFRLPKPGNMGKKYYPREVDQIISDFRSELKNSGYIYSRVQFEKILTETRSVRIHITVFLGDRYAFKVRGNSYLSDNYISEALIAKHRPDADLPYLINILKDIYAVYGFIHVQIADSNLYYAPEERTYYTSFTVVEGHQSHMASPRFEFRDQRSNPVVHDIFSDFLETDDSHIYYSGKNINDFTTFFIEKIKDYGFYQAQIITKSSITHGDTYWITPVFEVFLGDQAVLKNVTLSGLPEEITIKQQTGQFKDLINKPFGKDRTQRRLNILKDQVIQQGYLDVTQDISIFRSYEYEQADKILITLHITYVTGHQYFLKVHTYENTCETSPWVLDQYFKLKDGDAYNPVRVESSITEFYRTELFRSIDLDTSDEIVSLPENKQRVDRSISIQFLCSIRGNHEFGAGFFTETGFNVFSNFSYSNLWGDNQTVFVSSDFNMRLPPFFTYIEPHIGLSLFWPFIFRLPFDLRLSSDFQIVDELDVDQTSVVTSLDFEKQFNEWYKLILHAYEFSWELQHHFVNEPFRSEYSRLGLIGFTQEFSFVDHPMAPLRGHKHAFSAKVAAPFLGTMPDVYFVRLESNHAVYVPLASADRLTLAINGIVGLVQSTHNSKFIPRSEFFYLGGDSSLRGFDIRSLGLSTQIDPRTIHSIALANLRTELRLRLMENLYLFGFWDTGALWTNYKILSPFRHSAGGGLRLHTPLGAINLAVGFPVDGLGAPPNLVPGRSFDDFKIHLSLSTF